MNTLQGSPLADLLKTALPELSSDQAEDEATNMGNFFAALFQTTNSDEQKEAPPAA